MKVLQYLLLIMFIAITVSVIVFKPPMHKFMNIQAIDLIFKK